jgi:plastocyanin
MKPTCITDVLVIVSIIGALLFGGLCVGFTSADKARAQMGPGMMGPGMMGPGMMGPGTIGPGTIGPGTPYPNLITNTTSGTKTPSGIIVSIVKNAAEMSDKAYQPNLINIKVGDTITWINRDSVMHTVASGSGPNDPNEGKQFDSGPLTQGGTFTHTFKTAGVFNYFCAPHPWMVAKVIVK